MDYLNEIIKCSESFSYFAENYIKINHPTRGLVPLKLYPFQERVIKDYKEHKFNIISKFRQAGFTTITTIWGLWRCMFKTDQRIMVLSKSDREAMVASKIVKNAKTNLPEWLQPEMANDNDHEKEFVNTGSAMWFYTPEAARSRALTYLILDEAAFIQKMEEHWKAMYPTLAAGGGCIVISTVNGIGNWYEQTYTKAKEGKNKFHIIEVDYKEHPDYAHPDWELQMKSNLGPAAWAQEFLKDFGGSGKTYIKPETLLRLRKRIKPPTRKLFDEWEQVEEIIQESDLLNSGYQKGALWVWEEPKAGQEFLMAADVAEGGGTEEDDYSAFHVFNTKTLEQVAEFYSNTIPPHKFAQVLVQVGNFYNTAKICVENTMGPGMAVCNRLEHTFYYENLYWSENKHDKSGIIMNKNLRPLILETMQTCLLNNLVQVNSHRTLKELNTFILDKGKAIATRGKHDDLVISLAIAMYVLDVTNRDIPVGIEPTVNVISKVLQNNAYDEMKKLLDEGIEEDLLEFKTEDEEEDLLPKVLVDYKRPKIYQEFGF